MGKVVELLKRLGLSLASLGTRRLVALGATGLTVFLLVGISGYLLSRPQQEILYSGLDAQDVTRMGAALEDAGIAFDISSTGDSVLVATGQAAKARMLLAQKGLPRSDTAGYELFDKLGSLGLTSFMQQVTKVRALEGELARTIQLIDGIKAARVHLALRSEGSFRSSGDQPTASVIIKADQESGERAANAIRHLVAAAIPGLAPGQVSVMSSDGRILAGNDDPASAAPERLIDLERTMSSDVEARISRTLTPFLGVDNFRVSVTAKLNADRRQINETRFDPNSRVERSVRTIKESGEAQNAAGSAGVTVDQNIPVEEATKGTGDNSREKKDRKEELTNYEINSKSISTTSEGYGIDRMSIAVIVNRAVIAKMLGGSPNDDAIAAKVNELQVLAASASGVNDARGDVIKVTAVDFVADQLTAPEADSGGISSLLEGNLGSLINAGGLIVVTLLVLMLGLRPALRAIMKDQGVAALASPASMAGASAMDSAGMPLADMSMSSAALDNFALPQFGDMPSDPVLDSLAKEVSNDPRERLSKIVELDPDRAVEVLKQWLSEASGEAA